MTIYSICFCREIRKIPIPFGWKKCLIWSNCLDCKGEGHDDQRTSYIWSLGKNIWSFLLIYDLDLYIHSFTKTTELTLDLDHKLSDRTPIRSEIQLVTIWYFISGAFLYGTSFLKPFYMVLHFWSLSIWYFISEAFLYGTSFLKLFYMVLHFWSFSIWYFISEAFLYGTSFLKPFYMVLHFCSISIWYFISEAFLYGTSFLKPFYMVLRFWSLSIWYFISEAFLYGTSFLKPFYMVLHFWSLSSLPLLLTIQLKRCWKSLEIPNHNDVSMSLISLGPFLCTHKT